MANAVIRDFHLLLCRAIQININALASEELNSNGSNSFFFSILRYCYFKTILIVETWHSHKYSYLCTFILGYFQVQNV